MTKKFAAVLLLHLLSTFAAVHAQNGPDNDPDAAPGYTNSVFDHGPADSINLYNGQLTIPIAVGPSYPIGPKLRFQLSLVYSSRVDDYGAPKPGAQPGILDGYIYRPLVGNSSLGIGWELTLGAIKPCRHGMTEAVCYFGPDGSQHMFHRVRGNGKVTGDGSQLFLKGSGPYEMWDGDGNRHVFDKQASGFDDTAAQGYTHDFGRGRDGWYLGSLTDPHGNGYSVSYWTGGHPRWTYGVPTCSPAVAGNMQMAPPAGVGGWVPKEITLPSGDKVRVNRGHSGSVDGMILSFDFPVFAAGAAGMRTWSLAYDTPYASYLRPCGPGTSLPVNLQRIKELRLPSDLAGSPKYQFAQESLLTRLTLPTGGTIEYCYSEYTFHHGRAGSVTPNCPGLPVPSTQTTAVTPNALYCDGSGLAPEPRPNAHAQCTEDNEARWIDVQMGVLRRTETEPVRGRVATTTYTQYAFPFGEAGSAGSPGEPQTLTVVVSPPTDQNAAGSAGRRRAKATLFLASPRVVQPPGGPRPSVPGDRVGADVEERVFETDPNLLNPGSPACPGTAADAPFCASKSVRTVKRTFDYDDPGNLEGNRRVQSERTIFGPGACGSCAHHQVTFTNSTAGWEDNGRHYENEVRSGTLGNDARTTFTDWAPAHWMTGPPPGGRVLPNLFVQRRTTDGTSVRDELLEPDAGSGFLKGSVVYDDARNLAFVRCRYSDDNGNVDKEFSKTVVAATRPSLTYCSDNHGTFPASVGLDGDTFGKDYTWQNGELLGARWINGSTVAPTFPTRSYVRNLTTGWVLSSSDTSGRTTGYSYDGLGRVTQISPPAVGELKTFVCYEGPNATTAYRASSALACPVAASHPGAKTWEHFDYDGLGRKIREKRLLPGAQVSKRFTLRDGAGNDFFASEWVADATPETIAADLPTACVFSTGSFATARPSAAPGTYRLCFDPFGRPQQMVGSRHSSLATVDRKDGSAWYSDTLESALTYCVNGSFTNLQAATCSAGGFNVSRASRRDAFGRTTSVTEPTGETTSYVYDVNAKLTRVTQGSQTRSFAFDAAGILRSQTTPEEGTVSYDLIGSLGNVRQERRPDGLLVARKFDFAGRVAQEDAGGQKYLVQCFDGAGVCVDGSPNAGGGSYPAGKITRRYGFNYIPTAAAVVDDSFEYGDAAGRLTKLTTTAGNGDLGTSVSQTWSYDGLGLPAVHGHPRVTGAFPVSLTYSNALPTGIAASTGGLVTGASYTPAAGLASWTAGNSGAPVVTAITPDPTLLARPQSVSNPLWSSGTYAYDGEGNILKTGADTFTYDSRSRLLSAKFASNQRNFTHDRWGNLTQNGGTTFQIDALTNRLKPGNPGAPAYDGRGNLTAWNGDVMAYDALDRQYRNTNAGSDWVYLFNGAGERIVKFPAKFGVLRREMARYLAEANGIARGWALPGCTPTFADVSCTDPDARQIQLVYSKGVTGGCSTNPLKYCPDALLTRAQMAVFVVKGYKPDGFVPPPCQGTFQDVSCSGPYAPFAPWIEQLRRDGVTAGCNASPLQFCPGNTVGEWEMLVWLGRAPGPSPGNAFWSAYRPVPRGAIYTWRDEQNRVVTEAAGGTAGAATASLSVVRDNVFLGNLLVASYVASPAGWQFTASDHLGSPRVVWDSQGQLVESHKHWPYGEDTNPTPPSQRLSFCLMERDNESTRYYDHARTHDLGLGRFLSPDRIGGKPADPQSWNRYAYALNNPMKHIDPDGLLTIVVHGTYASDSPSFKAGGMVYEQSKALFRDPNTVSFKWSGGNTGWQRQQAAAELGKLIASYKFAPGEKLNIVAHSHGGNVVVPAANALQGRSVDNLITFGTPVRLGSGLERTTNVNTFIAVSNTADLVQVAGGLMGLVPFIGEYGIAGREQPGAINVRITDGSSPFGAHSGVYKSEATWRLLSGLIDTVVKPIEIVEVPN